MVQSRQLAAIMFTDIVGYTTLMQHNEHEAISKVEHFLSTQSNLVTQFNGNTIKHLGDGSLTIFDSAVDAVNCALQLQLSLASDPKVQIRIGIHTGDILYRNNEAYGDGINIAARLQTLGEAGSVIFSQDVFDKIKNHPQLQSVYLGQHKLKNVLSRMDVHALANPGITVPQKLVTDASRSDDQGTLGEKTFKSKFRFVYILLGLLVLAGAIWIISHVSSRKKTESEFKASLPGLESEVESLNDFSEGFRNWEIYQRLTDMKQYLATNSQFNRLWDEVTFKLSINTNVDGASIYAKPYSNQDAEWVFLGKSPLYNIDFPRGLSTIKIEHSKYITQLDLIFRRFNLDIPLDTMNYQLFTPEQTPEGMVYVTEVTGNYHLTPGLPAEHIPAFWIDRYEVTNAQFKQFLDSDGYQNEAFWDQKFVEGSDTLSFQSAMSRFRDLTGAHGPAGWEQGEIPKGEENLPVTGISWYEAAAYAKFAGKELPTLFHWIYLSVSHASSEIVKFGNFESKGVEPVGTFNSLTRFGTFDLPGNVAEWIFNANNEKRFVMGGNYSEPTYWYNSTYIQTSPWSRDKKVGFRCMKSSTNSIQTLKQNFDLEMRDYNNLVPVGDEIFEVYRELLKFNEVPLNPRLISSNEESNYVKEIVSVSVPYQPDPLPIVIFLPKQFKPPFQSVLYFPGLDSHNSDDMSYVKYDDRINFLVRGGRAVVWPVYYASNGRGTTNITDLELWKQAYRYMIADSKATVDYLETRDDFDKNKISFLGISWGGGIAPYILAIEDRISLGMVKLFGVSSVMKYRFKEFDQVDYLPRVTIPMLMLGGKYDYDYTIQQQQAFYDLLGTPTQDKKWLSFESSHDVPRTDMVNETLNWLDNHFGKVSKVE